MPWSAASRSRTSQFDRALQAKRQPGSSYKPLVYAAALDNGYKPTSIVLDAPIEIDQGPGKEIWQPKNYDGTKSFGPSTLRVGIEKSRNQMTVRLAQDMGMPLIVEYSKRFGVYDDLLPVLAMSLGAGETTLVKMATAYAAFANGGKQVKATLIDRIQDRWGHTIWRHDERECLGCKAEQWQGQAEPALTDDRPAPDHRPAHRLPDHLDDGGRGPARHRHDRQADPPQRADRRQDRHHQRREGRLVRRLHAGPGGRRLHRLRHARVPWARVRPAASVAAPIFANFMKAALADKKAVPFRIPPGIKLARVSLRTGLRAQGGEAGRSMEAFKPTEEPDDAYSVIGFTNESGTFSTPDQFGQPRSLSAGRSVY